MFRLIGRRAIVLVEAYEAKRRIVERNQISLFAAETGRFERGDQLGGIARVERDVGRTVILLQMFDVVSRQSVDSLARRIQ